MIVYLTNLTNLSRGITPSLHGDWHCVYERKYMAYVKSIRDVYTVYFLCIIWKIPAKNETYAGIHSRVNTM